MTIDSDNFVQYPDHVYSQLSTPMGQMTMAAWPAASYMNAGGQGGEMPPPAKEEALKSLKRDVIAVAQHLDDPKYTFTAAGTRKIGDVQTNVLKINADGAEATWYLDPKTNLPLRSEFSALGQAGPVNRASDYSDWKSFSGVNLYTTRAVSDNGKPSAKDTIKEWVVNPKIDPKIWEKPAASEPSGGTTQIILVHPSSRPRKRAGIFLALEVALRRKLLPLLPIHAISCHPEELVSATWGLLFQSPSLENDNPPEYLPSHCAAPTDLRIYCSGHLTRPRPRVTVHSEQKAKVSLLRLC